MVTPQVVLELSQSCVQSKIGREDVAVAVAEVLAPDFFHVVDVGSF